MLNSKVFTSNILSTTTNRQTGKTYYFINGVRAKKSKYEDVEISSSIAGKMPFNFYTTQNDKFIRHFKTV